MEDFVTWFCLKNRTNFTIDPQINAEDSQYYFGRDDIKHQLQKQIRRAFIAPGIPKMMIRGPYGSGKTQTLFYLKHYLCEQTPASAKGDPHTLYLTIEVRSNSTASNIHMQLLEALGKDIVASWVRQLFDTSKNFDTALLEIIEDPNIYKAIKELRATGESSYTAWRWLTGQTINSKELNGLQITRNLGDLGAGDLVNAIIAVGNLAVSVNQKIVYLIDEMEQLNYVKFGDAYESIHRYILKLSDAANSSIGFLIGYKADVIDDAPETLRRGDVYSRIGASNYIEVPPLPAVSDVKLFIRELLKSLTEKEAVNQKIAEGNLDSEHGIFPLSSLPLNCLPIMLPKTQPELSLVTSLPLSMSALSSHGMRKSSLLMIRLLTM
jgi:DNA polymerase III delta prime subunit